MYNSVMTFTAGLLHAYFSLLGSRAVEYFLQAGSQVQGTPIAVSRAAAVENSTAFLFWSC